MTHSRIAEWLDELEDSPHGTDTIDIERLLLATGHERSIDDDGLVVFHCRGLGTWWTLDPTKRYLPVGYVLRIARTLRARLQIDQRDP